MPKSRNSKSTGHSSTGKPEQAANEQEKLAERALDLKRQGKSDAARKPDSRSANSGMRPIPNDDIAPSGALDAEGHRPVVE